MEFFETSGNFTVALGKTLVHSLWIGLLFLSMLKITLQAIPNRFSTVRYNIATLSLLFFLVSLVTLFFLLYVPAKQSAPTIAGFLNMPSIIPYLENSAGNKGHSLVTLICAICSYIYAFGITIILIRTIFSVRHIRGLKRSGVPVNGDWLDRFLQIKRDIGIRVRVPFLESDSLSIPAIAGLLKPAIIVPAGMFTHLSMKQVETILMHELYHLRRFDFLVNLMQLIVEGLFFYNPAVWIISKMIRTERENCCDDRVLQTCGNPAIYARALFQLAEHQQSFTRLIPGAGGTDQHQLFDRIKRILNQSNMKTNIREKLYSLLLMLGGVIILLTVSGFTSGFSIVKHIDSKTEMALTSERFSSAPIHSPVIVPDTIPEPDFKTAKEIEKTEIEKELGELEELEVAKIEAMKEIEEIDWEEIKKEIEVAKIEAMKEIEEIDWDEIKKEMECSRLHIDSIMQDMDFDFDIDVDMEDLRIEMEETISELKEIDMESLRKEVEESIHEIDWKKIKKEMENVRIQLDSVMQDFEIEMKMERLKKDSHPEI